METAQQSLQPNKTATTSSEERAQAIQQAMMQLTATINQNGFAISDHLVDEIPEDAIELYRYPPDEYAYAICATPIPGWTPNPES